MNKTVFSEADILLPDIKSNDPDFTKWAVIACDQFTSNPAYWDKAEEITSGALTTLSFILPEAYLETEREAPQKAVIEEAMKTIPAQLACHKDSVIFIERTLSDGAVRRGIVGKIDIDAYEFDPAKKGRVSATEETVLSRIPPRVEIRRRADIELPHVMVFYDDAEDVIMRYLEVVKAELPLIYDFPLMLGGGHLKGYKVEGKYLSELLSRIESYEALMGDGAYAVGDGNHSLAAAKAYYEELKAKDPQAAESHSARYALCEIVNIHEEAIVFEPIYRILKNIDIEDFLSSLPEEGAEVEAHFAGKVKAVHFPETHPLKVGCMQIFIDSYLASHPQVSCDYIHGEAELLGLSAAENAIGFLCEGIEKKELLSYVAKNGPLPRKTFSMGEATTKRYYNEARYIK